MAKRAILRTSAATATSPEEALEAIRYDLNALADQGALLSSTLYLVGMGGSAKARVDAIFSGGTFPLTANRVVITDAAGALTTSNNIAWQPTDSRLLLAGAATSSISITGSGGTPSFASDPGGMIYMGQLGALPTTIDNSALIAKTDGSGSSPFNQAGSIVYRSRVSSTAGRSSHYFYTGSASTLRLTIDETGLSTFTGLVTGQQFAAVRGTITATTNQAPLYGSVTWNNAAITFTAIQLDVTDTLSATASALLSLRVGGVPQFSVRKDGQTTIVSTTDSTSITTGSLITAGGVGIGKKLVVGSDTTIGVDASTSLSLNINGAVGYRTLRFKTASLSRWDVATTSTAESGSNVGSDLGISAYSDAGALIDTPITITRAVTGSITLTRQILSAASVRINPASNTAKFVADASTWGDSKFDSQGVAWASRTLGTGLIFNGAPAERPEISFYRGARSYPEGVLREHTTVDTGMEIWCGNGTVQPTKLLGLSATQEANFSTTDATSTTTGSLITAGGVGIAKAVVIGTRLGVAANALSASATVIIGHTSTGTSGAQIRLYDQDIPATMTSQAFGLEIRPKTVASVFTLVESGGIRVRTIQIGAGSLVTNQQGIFVDTLSGATNNTAYGYGSVIAGAWGIAIGSSVSNYLGTGTTLLGSSTSYNFREAGNTFAPPLQVHGTSNATNSIGVARWTADASGPVSVGAKSRGPLGTQTIVQNSDVLWRLVGDGSDGVEFREFAQIQFAVDSSGTVSTTSCPGVIRFITTPDTSVTPTEAGRFKSGGQFLLGSTGNSAQALVFSTLITPAFQINATSTAGSTAAIGQWVNDAGGPSWIFTKSRGGAVNSHAVVQVNDFLGHIAFNGSDGTQFRAAARISAFCSATPGASDMPGTLVFATTPDGSAGAADRMTVDHNGQVSVLATTDATSATTGSIITAGGVGIAKSLHVGQSQVLGASYTTAGTAVFGATSTVAGDHGILVRNLSAGTTSYTYCLVRNDVPTNISMAAYGSGYTGTIFGIVAANYMAMHAYGASLAGLLVGCHAVDKPIIFGVNAVEVARFTGATLSTQSLAVKYTTDATSTTTGSITTLGGISAAKYITVDGASGATLRYTSGTANAAVATTLGSVGPTGSTAGNPQGWLRVSINGTDRFIPYW